MPKNAIRVLWDSVQHTQQLHITPLVVTNDRNLVFGMANCIAMLQIGRSISTFAIDRIRRRTNPGVYQFSRANTSGQL